MEKKSACLKHAYHRPPLMKHIINFQQRMYMKKIVVIGPESTGKSTLCRQLAQHYKAAWMPEFARQYLIDNGTAYTFNDLLTIAKGHVALEESYLQEGADSNLPAHDTTTRMSPVLFIDTDMYVMKVWCEFVFEQCHTWILDQIVQRKYDLYLYCNIDLPWVKDDLREYPDFERREKLYHMYEDILVNQRVPWINISGDYNQRLQKAIHAVDQVLA